MKTLWIILGIVGAAGAVVGGIYIYRKMQEKKTEATKPELPTGKPAEVLAPKENMTVSIKDLQDQRFTGNEAVLTSGSVIPDVQMTGGIGGQFTNVGIGGRR
jgi:ABC-type phosphate/phosphonate transport system substrate-binding protein